MNQRRTLQVSLLVLSAFSLPALADDVKTSIFTQAQAERGKLAAESSCSMCHLKTLRGRIGTEDEKPDLETLSPEWQKFVNSNAGYVPPIVGEEFLAKWAGKTAAQLAENLKGTVRSFPPANMDDTTYLAVTAYVLKMNGALAGNQELTASTPVLVDAAVGKTKVKVL